MKKRSGRNLIRFFYHFLVVLVMAMPLLSGLVRVIYVQSNMNAKDSYYGDTINEELYTELTSFNDMSFGFTYYYHNTPIALTGENARIDTIFYVDNFVVLDNSMPSLDGVNVETLTFYVYDNVYSLLRVNSNINLTFNLYNSAYYFKFTFLSGSNLTANSNLVYLYNITYNDFSYLDNAFDYSIWKTMQDFTFHSDFRFTDIANGMLMSFDNNNLYIQYINFYINWVLTCAVISFAPYVLLSFYHLAIGLLDKFMMKGEDL